MQTFGSFHHPIPLMPISLLFPDATLPPFHRERKYQPAPKSFRDRGCVFDPLSVLPLDVREFAQGRRLRPALGRTFAQPAARRRLVMMLLL